MPYWVVLYNDKGRPYLLRPPFETESSAQAYIDKDSMRTVEGTPFYTKTYNREEAARVIRRALAEKHGINQASRNFKHEVRHN